ncbi:MAG TPA: hypothetical protein VLM05_10470 [Mycobacteriales bacterium]|nr:hypothetical protein [Mycobacteriales bacterium]
MLIILFGVVALLFVVGGVIDFRTRRRKKRYRGLDAPDVYGNRDNPTAIEGQMRSRSTGDQAGSGFGGLF